MISTLTTGSVALCTLIVVNSEQSHSYLLCVGREEVFRWISNLIYIFFFFRYNHADFYARPGPSGLEFKGPLWHPLRLLTNLATWNMFILVPIFYYNIFKFRKSQDLTPGTYNFSFHNLFPKQNYI